MSENTEKKEVKKQTDLDLLNKMKALPGGLVIIPLVLAVLIATFFPQAYQIGGYVTACSMMELLYDGIFPDRVWIYNQYQTSWHAAV